MPDPKVVVFTCNWSAYSALETAGIERLAYCSATRPLKVMCLGQLSLGIILKAFQKGAEGVLLLGCPPNECHYEFGNRRAQEVFTQARELALRMGIRDEQIRLDWVSALQGDTFVEKVQAFCAGLNGR